MMCGRFFRKTVDTRHDFLKIRVVQFFLLDFKNYIMVKWQPWPLTDAARIFGRFRKFVPLFSHAYPEEFMRFLSQRLSSGPNEFEDNAYKRHCWYVLLRSEKQWGQ